MPAETTKKIYDELSNSKCFSPFTKSIKIIVSDNELILNGSAKSHFEVSKIMKIVNTLAFSYTILNQLEVVKKVRTS